MAVSGVLFTNVYIYFFILLRIYSTSAGHDEFFYDTHPGLQSDVLPVSLTLLQEGHHSVQKRGAVDRQAEIEPISLKKDAIKNDEIKNNTKFVYDATTSKPSIPPDVPLILSKNATKATKKVDAPPRASLIFPSNVTRIGSEKELRILAANTTVQSKTDEVTTAEPGSTTKYPPLLHDTPKNKTAKTNFEDFIDNITISKFTDKELNSSLAQHNITNETITETFSFYNSSFMTNAEVAKHYWVNLSDFKNSTTHDLLSSAHRRAATVTLSFEFPFYGHLIKNITIATGGFLYTGDYVHAWLAATQYIAPLMANFDTSLSNDSYVRYMDNGTAFTVVWEKVSLQDRPKEGQFTFQTTLHKNGDIIFVYKNVPTIIENIKDEFHPVKVGLSDAYIIDSTLFFLRRKTIYEYHRVNFQKEDIKNGTVVYLKALPTCLDQTDCESCLKKDIALFKCVWCPGLNKCSTGIDRNRQAWLMKHCELTKISEESSCSKGIIPADEGNSVYVHDSSEAKVPLSENTSLPVSDSWKQSNVIGSKQPSRMGISGILAIMLLISMVLGITMWVLYAYRYPHTTSGQMLIRYRPSQWTWKRGEARYTAATIHM